MNLSELAKYPMTRSVARSLCDSWASCWLRVKYTVSYSVVGLLCKWVSKVMHVVCRYCWWRSCSFCTQIYPKNAVFGSGCVHVTNFWIILQQSLSPVLIRRTCTQRSSSDIEIVCIHSIDMSKRVTGCVRSTRWTVNAPAPITQKQLDTHDNVLLSHTVTYARETLKPLSVKTGCAFVCVGENLPV